MTRRVRSVLAFDFGLVQMGVAVGNTELRSTQPLSVLRAKEGVPDWHMVEKLVREWQPDLLVVGDPLNMDGSDSELCERARKFARRLHGRLGLPVEMVDERLTSFEAKQISREQGHRGDYKRRPIDSQAAELVLQSWLGGQPEP
ncbi:MAG: Holliday junction resolvase RuvX [Gammaproteobacteria bacterium]|nr:Holliday junction resolvase RuvX [Gammaproteobacteria bacterium]MDH5172725.1 Holliday junction resolvase RuvX [Gammaproteobacteria bacterium]